MREYFLFVLVLVFAVFAFIQDLKKREVANWLNYSLVAFALAYRAFYSISANDYNFLLYGLIGWGIFYLIGTGFYYSGAFGGGDARFLAAIGLILPFNGYLDIILISLEFLIILFFVGAVYTILYSIYLSYMNRKLFSKEIRSIFTADNKVAFTFVLIAILSIVIGFYSVFSGVIFFAFASLLSLLYFYLRALDKCMIIRVSPEKLTEGDWIMGDIKIGKKIIKKTVHGLTFKDIELLRKSGKKIEIRTGIPFMPAILISMLIMVFFAAVLKQNFLYFLA